MSDTYTAPATPASIAARLAALEVKQGGSDIVQLLIRLYRLVLLGAQADGFPDGGETIEHAKELTCYAGSSFYQTVFGWHEGTPTGGTQQ